MSEITDDTGFKQALQGLDRDEQRLLAARLVGNVMSPATDDRIGHVVAIAGKPTIQNWPGFRTAPGPQRPPSHRKANRPAGLPGRRP
jgi:hypothetical protein